MHDKSKSLDVDEDIANRRKYNACANVKEQMVERLIKEGVNTQAAMSEGYERLCFLYVNALDGKNNIDLKDSLVLDAINYYQNAINYITKCENQHSPYKNIGNCLQIIKDYEHKPENKRSSSDEAMYDAARASMKSRMKDLGLGNLRFENPLDELYAKRWIENEKRERRAKGLLKNLTKEILKDSNKNEKQGQGHDNI